jgi:Flp pilus assembly protein TadD
MTSLPFQGRIVLAQGLVVSMLLRSCRFFHLCVVAIAAGLALGGCQKTLTTGSISKQAAAPAGNTDLLQQAQKLQTRFKRDPGDADTAIAYADSLKTLGRPDDSLGVLRMANDENPGDPRILSAYGREMLKAGNPNDALALLEQATVAGDRTPQTLSAQGAALDQLGRNDDARERYVRALAMAPDSSAILANLGLSYALSNRIGEAESTLRRAAADPAADPKVRQNLALVLALQGKFGEAETVAKRDLPPEDVAVNMAYLKQMMSSPDRWEKLKGIDGATG